MANKKKAAKEKEIPSLPEGQKPQEQPKKLQVWGLQETQKAVLIQANNRYGDEQRVIKRYQEDDWKRLVIAIAKEVGIPENINVRLDFQKMTLTEVPAPLVQSPITQDLTKTPA
jgi:hypothetical protein